MPENAAPVVSSAADSWPLSARDAAALLGINERTIRRAIGRGDLTAEKHAGVFRIDPTDLARFGGHEQAQPPATPEQPTLAFESPGTRCFAGNPKHALSAIHALTGSRAGLAAQRYGPTTRARQRAELSIVQRLCASALATCFTGDIRPETELAGESARRGAWPDAGRGQADSGGWTSGGSLVALTRREMDVLRLVALGESNREIADSLFISTPTVKRHLTNILGKFGATSRYEAVLFAGSHGLA